MKIEVKLKSGEVFEKVLTKTSVTLGRSSKCDFPIPDDSLSRVHCQIEYINDSFFITDLESANGVIIDGKKIPVNEKVAFTTFQEVQLGLIEITITHLDEEEEAYSPSPITASKTFNSSGSRNKSGPINRPLKKSLPKNKEARSSKAKVYILIFFAVMGATFYYFYNKSDPAPNEIIPTIDLNIPPGVTTPDAFLSLKEYQAKDATKSCNEPVSSLCKELSLEADNQEGILSENNEYFIFVRPQANKISPLFEKISHLENGLDIPIMYELIKSPIFESFQAKTTTQIHLVFKDKNYQISHVYRFHIKYFSTNGPERFDLLSELEQAFESGNLDGFWKRSEPIIHKQRL